MGAGWAHLGTSITASFLGSLVECVEAGRVLSMRFGSSFPLCTLTP